MPNMQAIIERLNALLNRESIDGVDPKLVAPGTTLAAAAQKVAAAQTQPEIDFINAWPPAQQEAVRAALYSALTSKPRLPVTMAWTPAYDYEVKLWEAAGTATSRGAMTIVLCSRYPGDAIPGALSRAVSRVKKRR